MAWLPKAADDVIKLLIGLANVSFIADVFPLNNKTARMTPLFMKLELNTSNAANDRLISNLCTLSSLLQLLERLALARLHCHFLLVYCNPHLAITALPKVA